MKKFIILCSVLITIILILDICYYRFDIYIDFQPNKEITTFSKTKGKDIYVKNAENKFEKFEIKGVDLGTGIPGHSATDYAINEETYLRWFKQIQELGANTIRVYTILQDDFYNAVYEYNENNPKPLYIIQGLDVDDYAQFSSVDAYSEEFFGQMIEDSKIVSDVIHGKRKILTKKKYGNGNYQKDISKWVIGYILGADWEDTTVAYTDETKIRKSSYKGKYMYTTEEATPFEAMLANAGDKLYEYETNRYKDQRLIAFSNWPQTDPFSYSQDITEHFRKVIKVDTEHIKTTENVISGIFASYHIYPYFPDYLSYVPEVSTFVDETGKVNTYREYLKRINNHHSIPVIVSEFGVPSSRGMAGRDKHTGRNQGGMSEKEQGEAVVRCYKDIKSAGCAGGIVFSWQDEWSKRSWNTMQSVDLQKTPYWSDYQTNEQYFGLLSFDPGEEKSICYVDGDISEWNDNKDISVKYDEKFVYFKVHKQGLKENEKIYIPINTTPKTGSTYCQNYDLKFDEDVDFVICIDGKENSRIVVQERYENLRAVYNRQITGISAYEQVTDKNTANFKQIHLMLQNAIPLKIRNIKGLAETYETGKLTYGNANPESEEFNSLADFCIKGDNIEIKIPWQLLNFSNPSKMKIHDDYYEHYGVEEISIKEMKVGVITEENKGKINSLEKVELVGWGENVTYHERLKQSYYILQREWTK